MGVWSASTVSESLFPRAQDAVDGAEGGIERMDVRTRRAEQAQAAAQQRRIVRVFTVSRERPLAAAVAKTRRRKAGGLHPPNNAKL